MHVPSRDPPSLDGSTKVAVEALIGTPNGQRDPPSADQILQARLSAAGWLSPAQMSGRRPHFQHKALTDQDLCD